MKRNHIIKILLLLFLFSCQQNKLDKERITAIGKELTKTEFTDKDTIQLSDVVMLGNSLREKMTELQINTTGFEFQVKEGDFEKPFGDNQADATLIINSNYKNIGIRLKYDELKDKYHIMGWKTLDEN